MNTDFKPCAIVPVFNHGFTAEAVVKDLIEHSIPVILIDDGSAEESKKELEKIHEKYAQCTLFTLKKNKGKGGAVKEGIIQAYNLGYSHALQVDADGQHDLNNIDLFIDEARQHPESLIAGYPQYDESVPKSRLEGRKITTFFVHLETLSTDITDAMCGFRVYPLEATCKLVKGSWIKNRMEFDIEILVKLHWKNIQMRFHPVKVIYPEGGISNFRMIRDNAAISFSHFTLLVGTFFRLPVLLFRIILGDRK